MIIFYGDNFELNLTNLKITFIDENALFYDAFFKTYSMPFTLSIDDETSLKLGLIDVENTSNYTVKHEGKLLIDSDFNDAYFQLKLEQQTIEGTLYFGKINLPLMDTPLSSLPFPLVNTSSFNVYKTQTSNKVYPDVSHVFPMVFDDEFDSETNYDAFAGIVNNYDNGYLINYIETGGEIINRNIMVPYPFLMEILKVGFASANRQMVGDFVNDRVNNYILVNPKNHLEKFSSNTYEVFQFSQTTDEYYSNDILLYEYIKTFPLNSVGSFTLDMMLSFPGEVTIHSLEVIRDSKVVYSAVGNIVDEKLDFTIEDILDTEDITVKLIIEATSVNIEQYNNFEFEKNEGKLNEFKKTYSLAEFMPDLTFGQFLSRVKNWRNLKVDLQQSYVRMDYIEPLFIEAEFKDESEFEVRYPKREFNQSKLYKLQYTDEDFIYVDKNGRVADATGYVEDEIIKIDMQLEVLPIEYRDGVFTAVRSDSDLSFLLYKGLDNNSKPVATDKVLGKTLSLQEVYEDCWKNWLHFRLNSETYTDIFTAHALEQFSINDGRYKYNKKHLYKKIKRTRLSEEQWEYEIESETL